VNTTAISLPSLKEEGEGFAALVSSFLLGSTPPRKAYAFLHPLASEGESFAFSYLFDVVLSDRLSSVIWGNELHTFVSA